MRLLFRQGAVKSPCTCGFCGGIHNWLWEHPDIREKIWNMMKNEE